MKAPREVVEPFACICGHYTIHEKRPKRWPPPFTRCEANAVVWLVDPDGELVPAGQLCQAHADAAIGEFREKLGETWTTVPIVRQPTSEVLKVTAKTLRALEVLAGGEPGGLMPGEFARRLWPDADGWRRATKCGPYGSSRGGGMRLAGGGFLGKLAKRGLAERRDNYYGKTYVMRWKLTAAGRDALVAAKGGAQ